MLYFTPNLWKSMLQPLHQSAKIARYCCAHPDNPWRELPMMRSFDSCLELLESSTEYNEHPCFHISETFVNGKPIEVREEVVLQRPYMNLLHFRKLNFQKVQPRLLIIAPLAGHFATLLRNTVRLLLEDNDIYITDWINARDVPLTEGQFHFDDYTDYVIDSLEYLGPNTHLLAICQPTVQALIATAVLSQRGSKAVPSTLTLISGPIDPRISPTAHDQAPYKRGIDWYRQNAVFKVPPGFAGAGQPVCPGFLLLAGLLSLSGETDPLTRQSLYNDLLQNAGESLSAQRDFLEEYFAVLDISAPFYLETIQRVFIDAELANGTATHREQPVDCSVITNTALLTIEGCDDKICSPGQSRVAHKLCSGIPDKDHKAIVDTDCGHYGTWHGHHFCENTLPRINQFIRQHDHRIRIQTH